MKKALLFIVIILLLANFSYGATNVYYSVCPFGTGNLLTGGSPTIVIDGSGNATLTLSGATQVDNIGIGVAVSYNSITSYISEITDATHFKLVSAVGVTASSQTSTAVTSINHEYASLSALEDGFTDASHVNSTNLPVADVDVYACFYYDHDDQTPDTSDFRVSFGNTSNTAKLNIYVPKGGTESIHNQRSTTGILDTNKALLKVTNPTENSAIYIRQDNCDIEGLQILLVNTASSKNGIGLYGASETSGTGVINIMSCNIKNDSSSTVQAIGVSTIAASDTVNIQNTIIQGFSVAGSRSIVIGHTGTYNLLNSIVYDSPIGVLRTIGTVNATNSVSAENSDDFNGTITILNCASDDGDGTNPQTLSATRADDFTDVTTGDFSITDANSVLYNNGTNTGAPSTDIIGTSRPQATTTDIGPFELEVVSPGTKLIMVY